MYLIPQTNQDVSMEKFLSICMSERHTKGYVLIETLRLISSLKHSDFLSLVWCYFKMCDHFVKFQFISIALTKFLYCTYLVTIVIYNYRACIRLASAVMSIGLHTRLQEAIVSIMCNSYLPMCCAAWLQPCKYHVLLPTYAYLHLISQSCYASCTCTNAFSCR